MSLVRIIRRDHSEIRSEWIFAEATLPDWRRLTGFFFIPKYCLILVKKLSLCLSLWHRNLSFGK